MRGLKIYVDGDNYTEMRQVAQEKLPKPEVAEMGCQWSMQSERIAGAVQVLD